MGRSDHIDDDALGALVSGNGAGGELALLAAFAAELRSLADGPAPVPSPGLAAMLAHGFSPGGGAPATAASDGGRRLRPAGSRSPRRSPVGRRVAGPSLAFRGALSAVVALAGLTAAGAAGALPGAAQRVVSTAVEAVTPFEFPEEADEKADFGERVSTDAEDGGVDGRRVSEDARDKNSGGGDGGGRPEAPGQAGLDRAGQTPAAGHAPSSIPGGRPESAGAPGGGAPATGGGPAGTPAAGSVPSTLPAAPISSVPPPGPVPGDVTGATPTLPPLPGTVPSTVPASIPTTVPDSIPPAGGLRR